MKYLNKKIHLFSASFGGIVGLCMGFSILSGCELLYFFTLRMWIDHRRDTRKSKKVKIMA